ncbi:hypothetical protein ACLOJK_011103 [Asimina triloba]
MEPPIGQEMIKGRWVSTTSVRRGFPIDLEIWQLIMASRSINLRLDECGGKSIWEVDGGVGKERGTDGGDVEWGGDDGDGGLFSALEGSILGWVWADWIWEAINVCVEEGKTALCCEAEEVVSPGI